MNGVPLIGVEREWKVRKQASKSFKVGPVGIRYIGYLHHFQSSMNLTPSPILNIKYVWNMKSNRTMQQKSSLMAINHSF